MMTNVPGESGDPSSPHYADLLDDWVARPLPSDAFHQESRGSGYD